MVPIEGIRQLIRKRMLDEPQTLDVCTMRRLKRPIGLTVVLIP